FGLDSATPYGGWIQTNIPYIDRGSYLPLLLNPRGGNVGIGTAAPTANLDVKGIQDTIGQTSLLLRSGNSVNNSNSNQIAFGFANTSQYRHAIKTRHNSNALAGNAIDFYVWNYGVDSLSTIGTKHVLTMDGNGNVGIGATNPSGSFGPTLHLYGGNPSSKIETNTGTGYAFQEFAESGALKWTAGLEATNDKFLINSGAFGYNANNRLTIQQDGNVGIGTTAPATKLHLYDSGVLRLSRTAYNSIDYGEIWSDGAGMEIMGAQGVMNLGKGNSSSYTPYLSLINGGNVGIGTTTPTSRLHVYGTVWPQMLIENPNAATN
ncbi:MAG: hypothetical protein WC838_02115, partial [Candidatus Margulisiibacteriota bacterium]